MAEIDAELRRHRRQISRLGRAVALVDMPGLVTHVDDAARKCRARIGTTADGQPVLSPWVRWAEPSGFTAAHTPMKVGDPVVIRSPGGVLGTASTAHRDGYTGAHPAPSDASDATVEKTGELVVTRRQDGFTIAVGGTSFAFSAAGLKVAGGTIEHDGVVIDKSHVHTGVKSGGDLSGPPPGGD